MKVTQYNDRCHNSDLANMIVTTELTRRIQKISVVYLYLNIGGSE